MQSAVSRTAIKRFQLLHISIHDSYTLELIGVSIIEKTASTTPDRRAPQIPYQNTAFSTLTEYFFSIFYS